jgi:dienelactone hydrolase
MAAPRFTVSPAEPAVDTELRIRLDGLPPGRGCTVRARTRLPSGVLYESSAVFRADAGGRVDLARDEPVRGSYAGADPMGLVWSMQRVREPGRPLRDRRVLPPSRLSLRAEHIGAVLARADVDRLALPDGVQRATVRSGGLSGVLFTVRGRRCPAVLLLGGAEGGLHEADAALLAGHGFAVLALAYFGSRGLPASLVGIPLEYFAKAMEFTQARRAVRPGPVGVVGGSRGGEAALLLASVYPQVGAAVSLVGGGLLTEGIGPGKHVLAKIAQPLPSWTLRGAELPYLRCQVTPEVARRGRSRQPFELADAFLPALDDDEAVDACTIPVERMHGAALLISAGDDRMWPSQTLSEVAADRLAAHGRPVRHVAYPEAGHLIAAPPYGPSTEIVTPGPGVKFLTGGTPQANAHARADMWPQVVAFLREHLG